MPVVMEQGASSGKSFTLPDRARHAPADSAPGDGAIEIGIVNNMPDAALEYTERQFIGLLAAASGRTQVRVRLFALPQIPRGDLARRRLLSDYAEIDRLWDTRLDGLIVTGMEPGPGALPDEPYWRAFTDVIDWAERNTTSSIWSCLAAHAVVLHRDGIKRRPFAEKCFGVYECMKETDHPLLAGGPERTLVPHSRWNDVPADALEGAGYDVLTRSPEVGADMFVRHDRSLFVFLQGHPEYEPTSLLREYRRDVGRFLRHEREGFPAPPRHYLDAASERRLEAFRRRALSERNPELLERFPAAAIVERLANSWHAAALRLYRNWLSLLTTRCERLLHEVTPATRPARWE
jgi:homoserine O-succinyltransferase/O-acetyltransferase